MIIEVLVVQKERLCRHLNCARFRGDMIARRMSVGPSPLCLWLDFSPIDFVQQLLSFGCQQHFFYVDAQVAVALQMTDELKVLYVTFSFNYESSDRCYLSHMLLADGIRGPLFADNRFCRVCSDKLHLALPFVSRRQKIGD